MLASTDLLTNISSAPEQYLIKKNHIQLKDQFLTIPCGGSLLVHPVLSDKPDNLCKTYASIMAFGAFHV